MTWKNPLETFDETGYTEFQRLNINASGEIDPAGERTVRKLFNSSTVDVAYKEFFPIIYKLWYSEIGFGRPTVATITDSDFGNTDTVDPDKAVTVVLKADDYWLVKSGTSIIYSDDAGANWTERTSSVTSWINPVKYGTDFYVLETNGQCKKWNKTTHDWVLQGTTWTGGTVSLDGSYELMSGSMLLENMMVDGDRFISAHSAEIGDGVATFQNVIQFYYSDDFGVTWNRGQAIDIETSQIVFLHRTSATQVVMFASDSGDSFNMKFWELGNINFATESNDFTEIGGFDSDTWLGPYNSYSVKGAEVFVNYFDPSDGYNRTAYYNGTTLSDFFTLAWDTEISNEMLNDILSLDVVLSDNDDECYIYASEDTGSGNLNRIYRKSPIIGGTGFTEVASLSGSLIYALREIQ